MSKQNVDIPEGYRMTELGPLPKNWEAAPFNEVILRQRIHVGKMKQRDYLRIGNYPVVDQGQSFIAGWTDDQSKIYQGKLPVIIFGDHTRIFKLIDFPFVIGADGVKVILPNTAKVDARFLYYTLSSLKIESRGYNRHYRLLADSRIVLPPLSEQKKIAFILSAVQKVKEKTEGVIASLGELKKSLMKHLFTYGPVPIEQAEEVELKETELGSLPHHWKVCEIAPLCTDIVDCPHSTPKWVESGVLAVKNVNIRDGLLRLTPSFYTTEKQYIERTRRLIPKAGDVLLSREAPIGEACIVPPDTRLCLGQRIMLLRTDAQILLNTFLVYAFYSSAIASTLQFLGKGVTAKHVNVADVKRLTIMVPPIQEQLEIAHVLAMVDAKLGAEKNRGKNLDDLFRTLLNDLMTAKIRVNDLEVAV